VRFLYLFFQRSVKKREIPADNAILDQLGYVALWEDLEAEI
jgi:hypothetical protein